jgi:plasmid maintenance system antidote protein VapI
MGDFEVAITGGFWVAAGEHAVGNWPEFWLNLQAAYDLRTAEREAAPRIEREVSPREAV